MMREKRPDRPKKIEVEEISSSEIEELIKKKIFIYVDIQQLFYT